MLKIDCTGYDEKIASEKEQVRREKMVIDFLSKEGRPVVVSLNDSQGVNISLRLNRQAYPGLIVQALEDEGANTISHNMSSLLYNKTYHVRMFLKNNISMSENARLQVRGAVAALKKAMSDFKRPRFIGNIGNLTRIFYRIKKGDKDLGVSDSIENADRPLILYSSGANDLMRIIGSNPASLKKDLNPKNGERVGYHRVLRDVKRGSCVKRVSRDISDTREEIVKWNKALGEMRYHGSALKRNDESAFIEKFVRKLYEEIGKRKYDILNIEKALSIIEKAYDPMTVKTVVKGMESNIEAIYRLNPNAVICVLGIYVPTVAEGNLLDKVAREFNTATKAMCERMGATYIDVSEIGSKYCFNGKNFHISPEGHEAVASEVLNQLYERFFGKRKVIVPDIKPEVGITQPFGVYGLETNLEYYRTNLEGKMKFKGSLYSSQRAKEISRELETEVQVARRVKNELTEPKGFQRKKRRFGLR